MQEVPFDAGRVVLNVARTPAAGSPIVLLHGVTRRWQDFLTLIPALAAHAEIHALDQRGHGRSGRTPGAYRVIDYVPDAVAYLREALDEPAVVLGHSLGAMVAAAAAAEAPDRVRALVLEDPTFAMTGARIGETGFPDLFRAFQEHAGSDRPADAIAADLADAPIGVPGGAGPIRLGAVRDRASLRFSAACLRRLDRGVLPAAMDGRWLEGYDVHATLARIACPTLLLQADFAAGGALPDAYAAELAGRIPGGTLLKLAGVGHNVHGTQAEAMLRLVVPFLGSLD